jgi:hypothetical protein
MDSRQRHQAINTLLARAAQEQSAPAAQAAYRGARQLIDQRYTGGATREPFCPPHNQIQMDQVHPPLAGDYCQPMLAPSRILVVPDIPAVGPQQATPGERLEFSAGGGWLIGWRGTAIDYTPAAFRSDQLTQASIGVRMFINDGEELITNGLGTDFARFSDLFPPAGQYAPILRRVDVKDILNLQFYNFQPLATGADLQVSVAFQFWREKYPGTG